MTGHCSHGKEVAEALQAGRWPHGCDLELRAHVDACARCADLVLVTQTFHAARAESLRVAHFDSPDLLWWRARLRRRNAAFERVSKPLTIAQTFAALVFVAVATGFVVSQLRHGIQWIPAWSTLTQSRVFHWEALWTLGSAKLDGTFMLLIPTVGALALLSGVVVYLASDKR